MDDDRLALQFLMTGGLTPTRSEFEVLHNPEDLDGWLQTAIEAVAPGSTTQEHLESAIELREAIFLTIRANTTNKPPVRAHMDRINHAAAQPPLIPLLSADGKTQRWQDPAKPTAALATIARDAIDLLTGPTADRVRECASPSCELVFVDVSPPGVRRWCAMKRCGNRSKTKAYRARQQH